MPVILATWEAEIQRIVILTKPAWGKKAQKICHLSREKLAR
jgi:hypothetical protein